ncbi:DUF3854 domain-containing protein [Richelia sinica]|uniref:DUF3854 domain-containing protein n=1 Tax=Richelia sinica TaxID=1357545 RepID=UPI0016820AA9|nr:DUF3854 domain-containing protein [Richelia sinica]MBD2667260.1 DUF3854 domain-containing protein [Richelia sinica FACHB-800]
MVNDIVLKEILQDGKLAQILPYIERKLGKHLFDRDGIGTAQLALDLNQSPDYGDIKLKRATELKEYPEFWGVRGLKTIGDGAFSDLATTIQVKVPKAIQDEKNKYYNDRQERDSNGKVKKYPKYKFSSGCKPDLQLFPLEDRDCELINLNPFADLGAINWDRVLFDNNIPIIITEGSKKQFVLLAYGFVVIGLPGVWQGMFKTPKGKKLLEQLKQFATKGRQFYIGFDNDNNPDSIKNVGHAMYELGEALEKETKVQPLIIRWEQYSEKGIDDLVAEHGIQPFLEAYKNAIPLHQWAAIYWTSIFEKPQLEVNKKGEIFISKYFPEYEPPSDTNKEAVVGVHGSGKTYRLKKIVRLNNAQGIFTAYIVPIQALRDQSASELNLPTIKDIQEHKNNPSHYLGCTLCIDSVKALYEHLERIGLLETGQFRLIFDEADQTLKHLVMSTTHVERKRNENIQMTLELIRLSDRTHLAEADLTRNTWDLINKLKPGKSYLAVNHYRHDRNIVLWDNHILMLDLAVKKAALNEKKAPMLITTQGGSENATLGVEAIEKFLLAQGVERPIIPLSKILVADPNHIAYGVLENKSKFDDFLKYCIDNNAILIVSPLLKTGFSIEEIFDFKYQFSLLQGVGTPQDGIQQIHRARKDNIERHIWVTDRSCGDLHGNGSKTHKGIKAGINYQFDAEKVALQDLGIELDEITSDALIEGYYCRQAAMDNISRSHYYDWVVGLLKYKWNYTIIKSEDWLKANVITPDNAQEVINNDLIFSEAEINECYENYKGTKGWFGKTSKEAEDNKHIEEHEAELLSHEEYQNIRKNHKSRPKPLERRFQKSRLHYDSGGTIPTTPENLKKFSNGLGKLRLHHKLLNTTALIQDDCLSIEHQSKNKDAFKPDFIKRTFAAKVKLLQDSGFGDFVKELSKACIKGAKDQLFYIFNIYSEVDHNFAGDDLRTPLETTRQKLYIDPNSEYWQKICDFLRSDPWRCKNLLGFTPPQKQNSSVIRSLLNLIGLTLDFEGKSGRDRKYYFLDYNDGRWAFFDYLDGRTATPILSIENEKTYELINLKGLRGDAVTSYFKDAIKAHNNLAFDETSSLTDLAINGKNITIDDQECYIEHLGEAIASNDYWKVWEAIHQLKRLNPYAGKSNLSEYERLCNKQLQAFYDNAFNYHRDAIYALQKAQLEWQYEPVEAQIIPVTPANFEPFPRPQGTQLNLLDQPQPQPQVQVQPQLTLWDKLNAARSPVVIWLEMLRANVPAHYLIKQVKELWVNFSDQFKELFELGFISENEYKIASSC